MARSKHSLKILEICPFSAGICGVWARVREESLRLSKLGYEVRVFSSNATKGSDKIAYDEEKLNNIKIKRFKFKKLGGESFMKWDFEKEGLKYSPDIIITHNYRHLHTTRALKLKEKLAKQGKKCKVFLVTHAPFVPDNSTRSFISKLIVKFYDRFIGPKTLNKFDKIIVISNWELEYLEKMHVKKDKITYIPNGIQEEFFSLKKYPEKNKILFLGRISPIKNLEVPIKALKLLDDKTIILELVGPSEDEYKTQLINIIKKEHLENRVIFSKPIYELTQKIKKIDSAKIFILTSKKEGMPQSLIEAMARSKIVLGSDILAIKDLIFDKINGYLFKQGDELDLANKIHFILGRNNDSIKKQARLSVEKFSWKRIIAKIVSLF